MATTNDVEAFAQAALDKLASDERSVAWLARQTGIAESTLAYQLKNPRAVSLRVALAIAPILGLSIDRQAVAA